MQITPEDMPLRWFLTSGRIWNCGDEEERILKWVNQIRFNHHFCLQNLGFDWQSQGNIPSNQDGRMFNYSETF